MANKFLSSDQKDEKRSKSPQSSLSGSVNSNKSPTLEKIDDWFEKYKVSEKNKNPFFIIKISLVFLMLNL